MPDHADTLQRIRRAIAALAESRKDPDPLTDRLLNYLTANIDDIAALVEEDEADA